ncbi:AAA family ATPase [Clostridium beijerinckii]|uniref:AAA family ATPase n=1 Tax=Clostridium beijerinckii TaxID=1520 RepID=UPI00080A5D79|nr:AAA family ATPase [Clostridium beijerinckii]OCB00424.1 hypothetical protein BGS1_15910 [Clostridium beijerinckii]
MRKIKSVEFNNFRVYRQQGFEINPDAKVILIYGNNGLGKTSFFDGIEWGLTGSIQRYDKSSKERNEYDILRNTFSNKEDESYVKIIFDNDKEIKRSIVYVSNKDYNIGKLDSDFIIDEELISNSYYGKIKFEESFCFSQFLSQELIDKFIRDMKDTDRYSSIKNILGLHRYEKYEAFINNVKLELDNNLVNLDIEKDDIINKIEIARAKRTNTSLSDEIVKLRYKKYFYNNINDLKIDNIINELTQRVSGDIQIYEKLDKDIKVLKQVSIDLEELNEQKFNKFIENEMNLSLIRKQTEKIKEIVDNIKKYEEIKYLNDNLERYLVVSNNKERYEIIKNDNETKNSEYLKFKQVNEKNVEGIINFFEDNKIKSQNINMFKRILSDIEKASKLISNKDTELQRIMSFKQEFINTTLNYLKNNTTLEKCPVCNQTFNIMTTINNLKNELKNNSDTTINDIIEELHQGKLEFEMLEKSKQQIEKQLIVEFINLRSSLEKERNNLKDQMEVIYKNELFAREYMTNLGKSGIELDKVVEEYNKCSTFISNLNGKIDKELYLGAIKELEENELILKNEIGQFKRCLEKYNIKSFEEVTSKLMDCRIQITKLNDEMDQKRLMISELKEMQNHYNNSFQDRTIELLIPKLEKINKELDKITVLKSSFEVMVKKSREVLLNEVDRILKSDELPIKIIYNYLNPNYNFEKLNFRIDDSNPKNNRLILEAISGKGAKLNPAYSFSSAQNNVLAVSIFLSFALTQSWSNLDCIFMDDPIQNMDDININNFVDIIRNVVKSTNKQIFISTHDVRIFEFMKNKFGDNVQVFNFIDYGKKIQAK